MPPTQPPLPPLEQIQIRDTRFLNFAFYTPGSGGPYFPEQIAEFITRVSYTLPRYDPDLEAIFIHVLLAVHATPNQAEMAFAGAFFEIRVAMSVNEPDHYFVTNEQVPYLVPSPRLYDYLASVAYDTCRGLVVSKTSNTLFDTYNPPLISPKKLTRHAQESLPIILNYIADFQYGGPSTPETAA